MKEKKKEKRGSENIWVQLYVHILTSASLPEGTYYLPALPAPSTKSATSVQGLFTETSPVTKPCRNPSARL
ncbi:uncharacterized protein LAJ45_10173 [Morchella importuna]|uniref:uncharacterized protein n=1 Tax=Morchella importuna TaxID=1174673 RepID=UPI001E8DE5A6|nr:uncharacterized protein LAJ45_10173 [Morchella importuna]KAH8145848.1 hypothetical protein LAJ45_10173 [Morchella importuna]